MARYAQVQDGTGLVVNVVEWDGDHGTWQPPAGCTMIEDTGSVAGPGWTYAEGVFTAPPPPEEPPT